jgi:hypothetical protein
MAAAHAEVVDAARGQGVERSVARVVRRGPELANPLDPGSEATGNTRYVLNEIHESPSGIENHWRESQKPWGDFEGMAYAIA